MNGNKPLRNQTADLLKGIAVLLMIQVHVIELFSTDAINSSRIGHILLFIGGPPVAPVFAVIFGYYIFSSNKTTSQFFFRGLKVFGLAMLLNLALNFNLLFSVSNGIFNIDVWPYIFGVDILHFAGLSLLLIALLKKQLETNLWLVGGLILLSVFLGQTLIAFIPNNDLLKYVTSFFYGSTTWSYFPLFPWLTYPLLGILFYKLIYVVDISFLQKRNFKIVVYMLFSLFLVLTIPYAISISSDLLRYYHHDSIFTLWIIVFMIFYVFLVNEMNSIFGQTNLFKYIAWLGKHVTFVYVIQWILIGNTATVIFKTINSPLTLIAYYIGIVIIVSAILFLKSKVMFLMQTKSEKK